MEVDGPRSDSNGEEVRCAVSPTRDLGRYGFIQLLHRLKQPPVTCGRMLHAEEIRYKPNVGQL